MPFSKIQPTLKDLLTPLRNWTSKFGIFFFFRRVFFMPWFDKNDVFYIRIRFLATIYTWKDSNSRKRNVWCDKSHVWTHLVAIKVGTHRASTWRPKCERKKVDSDMVKWAQSGPIWPIMSSNDLSEANWAHMTSHELIWPLTSAHMTSHEFIWPLTSAHMTSHELIWPHATS